MTLRFTMLASGSGGNSALVQAAGFGVLLDAGVGPDDLESRLVAAGHSWGHVHAMLLTHTHSDHWNERTFGQMVKRGIRLHCATHHQPFLTNNSAAFVRMLDAGLVSPFAEGEEIRLAPGIRVRALRVRHDGGATFGFRIDGSPDLFGRAAAVGYVSDLGTWDDGLAAAMAEVDLLAVEFNHDLGLERQSRRPAFLIARVLGDEGHLSNDQAAALVSAILQRSSPGRLKHLVQLHLSGQCNRPNLARQSARAVLPEGVRIHTAEQHRPGRVLRIEPTGMPDEADLNPLASPAGEADQAINLHGS